PVQYWNWVLDALRLELGHSWVSKTPVWDDIRAKFPLTLLLAGSSVALSLAASIPIGALAAFRRGGWFDRCSRVLAMAGTSMPRYWLAFVLLYVFAIQLVWLRIQGRGGWQHLLLPVL